MLHVRIHVHVGEQEKRLWGTIEFNWLLPLMHVQCSGLNGACIVQGPYIHLSTDCIMYLQCTTECVRYLAGYMYLEAFTHPWIS